jgi:hypothetical protein
VTVKNKLLVISVLIGLAFMVITTEVLSGIVWPSLFIGVPVEIIASVVSYLVLKKVTKSH